MATSRASSTGFQNSLFSTCTPNRRRSLRAAPATSGDSGLTMPRWSAISRTSWPCSSTARTRACHSSSVANGIKGTMPVRSVVAGWLAVMRVRAVLAAVLAGDARMSTRPPIVERTP